MNSSNQIYRCKSPGCSTLIEQPGYCHYHKHLTPKPFNTAIRYNTHLYQTSKWKQIRREIIIQRKCCELCGSNHQLEVHHIVRPKGNEDLFYDVSNLRLVCIDCHRRLTALETRRG